MRIDNTDTTCPTIVFNSVDEVVRLANVLLGLIPNPRHNVNEAADILTSNTDHAHYWSNGSLKARFDNEFHNEN